MAPRASSLALVASVQRRARSRGVLATLAALVVVLAAILGAVSTIYNTAFEAPPKRPVSGYILWVSSRRQTLTRELGAKPADITKALGAEWSALPEAEKAEWNAKAAEARQRYEEEKAAWESKYGLVAGNRKRAKREKPKEDSSRRGPKAPTAYNFYVKANAKKTMIELGSKITEAVAELGRRWTALTDVQKAPYVEEAATAKAEVGAQQASPAKTKGVASARKAKGKRTPKVKGKQE